MYIHIVHIYTSSCHNSSPSAIITDVDMAPGLLRLFGSQAAKFGQAPPWLRGEIQVLHLTLFARDTGRTNPYQSTMANFMEQK